MKFKLHKLLMLILLSAVFLSACRKSNFEEIKDPSQVAAKVNGNELTVHQVNQLMRSMSPQLSSENLPNQVLDKLISQELLLQQALDMKLDRDPDALLAIEAAKKQIIVDTYLQKINGSREIILDSDLQTYFNENPKLFSLRKEFIYKLLAIQLSESDKPEIIEAIKSSDNIDLLLSIIKEKQFEYKVSQETKTTEKLNRAMVEPLYSLSKADIGYLNMSDGLLVIQLVEVKSKPVSLDEAKPAIYKYLQTNNRKNSTEDLITNLREKAQIEYIGNFKPVK
ncbi:MAG: EpsD family peptidyl-prolyl cis-trans isomerase [Paraglaciecola sp.]|uniref:EpsD family peptidyl-prolyl cis-trans isomerase n=1 Tax=Paraglaciecola sp. TaxID=1920173 RepID=UPI0032986A6A